MDEAGRTTDAVPDPGTSRPDTRVGGASGSVRRAAEGPEGRTRGAQPGAPAPRPKASRTPQLFAIVGVVIAIVAASLYLFTKDEAPPRLTPEETVTEFLSAVFLSADPARVSTVICKSWDPSEAISRTTGAVEADAHVSWDQIALVSSGEGRANARARLGIRLRDDTRVSVRRQWRFNLVDEDGWRVCDARPLT